MDKTTLYLDSEDYRRLKRLALRQKVTPASLVREAVAEYVVRHDTKRVARSVASARSGRPDLGERAEDFLAGFGKTR